MDREAVAAWLAAYLRAWESYDEEAIGDLFAEDATYWYHPFDEPYRGRAAIVRSWLEPDRRDQPGTYAAEYQPIAVDGDVAVANGRSRYYTDERRTTLLKEFDNIFLIRFDAEGRCASFREWYMEPRELPTAG
jgi:ketosteroid isomerase-like protein